MVHFYTAYLTAGDYKTNGKIVQLKTIDFYFLELRSKFKQSLCQLSNTNPKRLQ